MCDIELVCVFFVSGAREINVFIHFRCDSLGFGISQMWGKRGVGTVLRTISPRKLKASGDDASKMIVGVASPFFSGILLSRKPPKTLGKCLVCKKNDGG